MSVYTRLALALVIVAAAAGAWWKLETALDRAYDRGRTDQGAEDKAAADAQTASNRELSRLAEQHLHALASVQSKFLTKTATEAVNAASSLAACPVPEPVRVRLNAAARCARGDSPGACGPGDAVPGTR